LWPPIIPCIHHESIMPCETLAPGRLKPKNGPLGTSLKNWERSARKAARKPSNTSTGSPRDCSQSSPSVAGRPRQAQLSLPAWYHVDRYIEPLHLHPWRTQSRPLSSNPVASGARRDRRHSYPFRFLPRAGRSAHARAGRARCSGIPSRQEKTFAPPSCPPSTAHPWLKTIGRPEPQSL
jgi:hypothetical protein